MVQCLSSKAKTVENKFTIVHLDKVSICVSSGTQSGFTSVTLVFLSFLLQAMSGSHSTVQSTRTTVLLPWRTSVKVMMMMMPCSAELI